MPDWKSRIADRMAALDLPADIRNDVISELASHVEDSALADEHDRDLTDREWQRLSHAIKLAKSEEGGMNRTKSLWIPMFVNLLLTSVLINLCDWLGWIHVRMSQPGPLLNAVQPWLLTLPFCGGTAAFLALRSRGSRLVRVVAALAPPFVWLAAIPVVQLILISFPNVFAEARSGVIWSAAIGWFLLPVPALLVGALPFLMVSSRQVQS